MKELGNYVCEGQIELVDYLESIKQDDYKRKPLEYHMGLSAYYYKCPYCKAENSEAYDSDGCYCKCCNKYFDGVIEKKSKDLIECENQLGLGGGAVYKDDKGKWHYSENLGDKA